MLCCFLLLRRRAAKNKTLLAPAHDPFTKYSLKRLFDVTASAAVDKEAKQS